MAQINIRIDDNLKEKAEILPWKTGFKYVNSL